MKGPDPILVVEDKAALREVVRQTLEAEGYSVDEAADARAAIECIGRMRYAALLTDLRLPKGDGHEILRAAVKADPEMPVILMTAYGTIRDAVDAMREGAYDYLEKPVDGDHLLALLKRALAHRSLLRENLALKERFARDLEGPVIVGRSAPLVAALEQVRRVAPTDATVLLEGESGTGKELFARAVHHQSARAAKPFLALNCAAIPENLLESELFGHEKGAFTGAVAGKRGKFEIADRGTLFLDEIGDLSPALQGKVLRVIEQKQFERVGGNETRTVDIRLVAATNRMLRTMVAEGKFRQDLYFRLSVFPITVPPLRDRRDDVLTLAEHFAAHSSTGRSRRTPARFSPAAEAALLGYAWPGNVRELQNAVERALILCDGTIEPEHLHLPGGFSIPASRAS